MKTTVLKTSFIVMAGCFFLFLANQSFAQLSGIYAIDGAGTASTSVYEDFQSAVDDLMGNTRSDGGPANGPGVSGPVVINVNAGTYTEQIRIPYIQGVSSTNRITFQSTDSDSTVVILQYDSPNGDSNYVVMLDSSSFISFKQITLKALDVVYMRVVCIDSGSHHVDFLNNVFRGLPVSNTTKKLVESTGDCNDSCNIFLNNVFIDGSIGIELIGKDGNPESGTQITNNTFLNQYFRGISLGYQNAPVITDNIIRTNSDDNAFTGIAITETINDFRITNNQIITKNTTGGLGMRFYHADGDPVNKGIVGNNFITVNTTGNTTYGIYTYYSENIRLLYNSVNITGDNEESEAFRYHCSSSVGIEVYNNIFANYARGFAVRHRLLNDGIFSDYNAFYVVDTNFYGHSADGNEKTLADWHSVVNMDTHSVFVNPYFLEDTNLHAQNMALNAGMPLPEITVDIDGEPRDGIAPDIGADEFDADVTPVDTFGVCEGESVNIYVLGGETYTWSVAGTNDSLNVTPAGDSTFYVTVTAGTYSIEDSIFVEEHANPAVDIGPDTSINTTESITLDAGGGFSEYEWQDMSTSQTCIVDGSALGEGEYTYEVTVTDVNGCTAWDSVHVSVTIVSEIMSPRAQQIFVYPNPPAGGRMFIDLGGNNNAPVRITLTDVTGKMVVLKEINCQQVAGLDVSGLKPGVYFLELRSRKGILTREKIVMAGE